MIPLHVLPDEPLHVSREGLVDVLQPGQRVSVVLAVERHHLARQLFPGVLLVICAFVELCLCSLSPLSHVHHAPDDHQ